VGKGAEDPGPAGGAEWGTDVIDKASRNRFGWLTEEEDLGVEEVRREEAPAPPPGGLVAGPPDKTELTDEHLGHLRALLPPPRRGRGRRRVDDRKTLAGVLYMLHTGCRQEGVR
jgi:hypothetical protein